MKSFERLRDTIETAAVIDGKYGSKTGVAALSAVRAEIHIDEVRRFNVVDARSIKELRSSLSLRLDDHKAAVPAQTPPSWEPGSLVHAALNALALLRDGSRHRRRTRALEHEIAEYDRELARIKRAVADAEASVEDQCALLAAVYEHARLRAQQAAALVRQSHFLPPTTTKEELTNGPEA